MKKDDRIAQNDAFWDIDDMLPARKPTRRFSHDVDTVEIAVDPRPSAGGEAIPRDEARLARAREALQSIEQKQKLRAAAAFGDRPADRIDETPDAISNEPILSYEPTDNPLLERVTVRPWPARYTFYERFRRDAKQYFDRTAPPQPSVPFFSYTPQYVQLSAEQLSFYFYWRDRFRHEEAIDADYPYLLLYLYEVINLPERIPPAEGAVLLARLWLSYRDRYPKLDRLVPEWLCDYCLIHAVPPPTLLANKLDLVTRFASLKEYYIGYDTLSPSPFASALLAYGTNYDFRKSKFLTEENRAFFETHIRRAFLHAFSKVENESLMVFVPIGRRAMTRTTVKRDAYAGALCAYDIKRRIEVTYLSCSRSIELRYTVTDTVKLAENHVRALLGIRSRFHTPNLPEPLRRAIEDYFAPLKRAQKKETPAAPPPAYEALYEPEHISFSPDLAKDIEARAWATTELLTDTDDGLFTEDSPLPPPPPTEDRDEPTPEDWLIEALTACLTTDRAAFSRVAAARHLLPDALAEAINETLFPLIGDVTVEEGETGYHIVPDYLEELTAWMKK